MHTNFFNAIGAPVSVIVWISAVLLVALQSFTALGGARTYDITILLDEPHPYFYGIKSSTLPNGSGLQRLRSWEVSQASRQTTLNRYPVNRGPVVVSSPAKNTQAMKNVSRKAGGMRGGLLSVLGTAAILSAAPFLTGDTLTTYGDIAQIAIPATAAAISALKSDGDGLWQLGANLVVTLGTTHALKFVVDRERPNGSGKSFPSGHTASAFLGASYLHYRYGWEYALPAYAAAGIVGYSRVEADEHHWEDVFAAAVIANLAAYVLTDELDESVSVIPFIDWHKQSFGIVAKLRF